jgi:protein kinase-like protein/uncharacterized protein DUF4384
MPDDARAENLAAQISDGATPNWKEALDSATDEGERRMIERLRVLEGVAQYHRIVAGRTSEDAAPAAWLQPPGTTPAPEALTREARWGHLELRERLGGGAFGDVYRAWDSTLDREVALKLLKREVSSDPSLAPRVVEEGRMLAKLRHPHVVTVFGADVHEGRVGVWMELIRGRSLEQQLRMQGTLGAREAALVGIDMCRALAATHRAGVLHRDVKAQNVMREEGGRLLLTDFGAGVEATPAGDAHGHRAAGTPLYMAPELFSGEPASTRSDLYSLGVLLHHLVTGRYPVEGDSWDEIQARHAFPAPRLLRDERPDLPDAFVRVVERATAPDPEARYATAGQMEQALALAIGSASDTAIAGSGTPIVASARAGREHVAGTAAGTASRRPRALQLVLPITLALAALMLAWAMSRWSTTPEHGAGVSTEHGVNSVPTGGAQSDAGGTYSVEAALYRTRGGTREKLAAGEHLVLGDRLNLEFQASAPLHVYVIDEDDAGHAFALFPLPGLEPANPLKPGETHVLPGTRDGKSLSWTVDTPGGQEHLLVLASPTRLVEFEAEMNGLARPGDRAVAIPEGARVHLRGMGALSASPAPASAPGGSGARLFDMAERLAGRTEVASGVWLRRVDFENPKP